MLLLSINARHPLTGELLPVLVSPIVNFGDYLDAIIGEVKIMVEQKKLWSSLETTLENVELDLHSMMKGLICQVLFLVPGINFASFCF